MPSLDEYLTVGAAAAYLSVHPNTLRNWDRDGKIPVHRHPRNGYRLFLTSDLETVLADIQQSGKRPTGWERPERKLR